MKVIDTKSFKLKKMKSLLITTGILFFVPFSYAFGININGENANNMPSIPVPYSTSKTIFESSIKADSSNLSTTTKAFVPIERVRSGVVESINYQNNSFIIKIKNTYLLVETSSSTAVYFSEGEIATIEDIYAGKKIYSFGFVTVDNSVMSASKIVISNKTISSY